MSPVGTCWELWGEASAGTPPRAASALGISNHSNATGQSPENTLHLESHTLSISLVSCGLVDAYRVITAFRQLTDPHQSLLNCLVFALNGVMIDCNADTWRSSTTLTAPTLFSSLQSVFWTAEICICKCKTRSKDTQLFSLWATFKNCEATWSKYTKWPSL